MSENQNNMEQSVDRRTDTVVTQQPGYASTQQVTHDAAAERRMQTFQISRIVYTILGLLEILLGLRFVLKLIAANPDSGFGSFIYGITNVFVAPFVGLTGTPASGGNVLEVPTLIAMVVYALLAWLIVRGIAILTDRPSARSESRTVQEQTGDGTTRTTNTVQR